MSRRVQDPKFPLWSNLPAGIASSHAKASPSRGRRLNFGCMLSQVEEGSDGDDPKATHRRRHFLTRMLQPMPHTACARLITGLICLYLFYIIYLSSSESTDVAAPAKSPQVGRLVLKLPKGLPKGSASTMAGAVRRRESNLRATVPTIITDHSRHNTANGLLSVDPQCKLHPITQLISEAKAAWDLKNARQSRTLKEAVGEYKRRYKRAPPIGFDKWWRYVVEHNVQLPDEYDQIEKDIAPFYAMSPPDLRQLIEKSGRSGDTYTLTVKDGVLTTESNFKPEPIHFERLDGQTTLIKNVAKDLPDMVAVYTVHDTPHSLLSQEHRAEIKERIIDGEFINIDENLDGSSHGWESVCSHSSLLRQRAQQHFTPPVAPSAAKSFIVDHGHNMDFCEHPDLIGLHGYLAGKDPLTTALLPQFTLSKTMYHGDVLGVPTERVGDGAGIPHVPWEEKTHTRLLWRGGTTGMHYDEKRPWRDTHRMRLMKMGAQISGETTHLAPPSAMNDQTVGAAAQTVPNDKLNEQFTDLAFVGKAMQCDKEDGTCEAMTNEYPWGNRIAPSEQDTYKYIVDVDGNAWSARFYRLLVSGSLVFKSTLMPEWWNDRVQPWVHYVPIKLDYRDLYDALAYFRGDTSGNPGQDAEARAIGEAGREWALTHYRNEDMTAYAFRLYLEWARVQSDRAQSFVYNPSMEMPRT